MNIIKLPFKIKRPVLACGADMKGAFALARGDEAYLFDGFGDLSDLDNFTGYEKAVKAVKKRLNIKPEIVVCDLHPGYFSTQFAESLQLKAYSLKLYKVQHHEAHIASAIVDNHIRGEVLGVAFDGTGYGTDGNIWGGEFFSGNIKRLKRVAHLDYIPMPGGEVSIREPWRMAASYLYSTFGPNFLKLDMDFVKSIDKKGWKILRQMIDKKINSPLTSSVGRLFDAAGSIILNKANAEFEAQLPIELERIAQKGINDSYNAENAAKIIKGMKKDIEERTERSIISAKFHNSIAELILRTAKKIKIKKVVLSGGVFQNRYLSGRVAYLLGKNGFMVFTHSRVETNDSGIPIGQIAIANERAFPPSHSMRIRQSASANGARK